MQLKTNSGPAYSSHRLELVLETWGVRHLTGVPHSPTGQVIAEHAHGILKALLDRQKRGNTPGVSPQEQLDKATYVLNVLNFSGSQNYTAKDRHFSPKLVPEMHPEVFRKDLQMKQWEGPVPLLTRGQGYACLSLPTGPYCI